MIKKFLMICVLLVCRPCFGLTVSGVSVSGNSVDHDNSRGVPEKISVDVCVLGGTAGGYSAFMSCWRENKTSVLVNSINHDYGMMAGGLSAFDVGSNINNHGGNFKELVNRIFSYYATYDPSQTAVCGQGTCGEPSVIKNILDQMVDESLPDTGLPGFDLIYKPYRLVKVNTSYINGKTKIKSILVANKNYPFNQVLIKSNFFIDASYEQDLMSMAGLPYIVGREDRNMYDEWLAGQVAVHGGRGIYNPLSSGTGDKKVQAYTYRLIVKKDGTGLNFPKPKKYNPSQFTELINYITENNITSLKEIVYLSPIPNSKYDMNANIWCWQSSDYTGKSLMYPNSGITLRNRIEQSHIEYLCNLMYFLKNSPDVPASIRSEAELVKLTDDEFTEYGGFSPQLYVREGKRLKGNYVITLRDICDPIYKHKADPICLGTYMIDCHAVDKWIHYSGWHLGEGLFIMPRTHRCYQIPYHSLYSSTHTNFLTAFGISASHVAFCSIRMEPQFMHLGQAAGIAACVAIDENIKDVAQVPYSLIKQKLESSVHFNQVLYPNDPFSVSNWNPALNETVTFTRGVKDSWGSVKWDFDGNGSVDAEGENVVRVKFPHNKVYRVSLRASLQDTDRAIHPYTWAVYAGDKLTLEDELLFDNNNSFANPDSSYWNWSTTHIGFIGNGFYIDNNENKGTAYYEYSFSVPESGYYDVALSMPHDLSLTENYADNVPVEIEPEGKNVITLNFDQSLVSYDERPFMFTALASVYFEQGKQNYLRIKNQDTTVKVAADALFLTPSGSWEKDTEGVYVFNNYIPKDADNDGQADVYEIY